MVRFNKTVFYFSNSTFSLQRTRLLILNFYLKIYALANKMIVVLYDLMMIVDITSCGMIEEFTSETNTKENKLKYLCTICTMYTVVQVAVIVRKN